MMTHQTNYAETHGREMAALVLMVDAMQQGNQNEAVAWARQMEAATNAKMGLLALGMSVEDADRARALAEASFEREHPGVYQSARSFMYALKARMGR